jgi:hypothetical protein
MHAEDGDDSFVCMPLIFCGIKRVMDRLRYLFGKRLRHHGRARGWEVLLPLGKHADCERSLRKSRKGLCRWT